MPVDRGAIDAQLREIGEGEGWWEQREFRALPSILQHDVEQLQQQVAFLEDLVQKRGEDAFAPPPAADS